MYVAVRFAVVSINKDKTINGRWAFTLSTIKGEVPSLTAIQAVSYPVVTVILYPQGCIIGFLDKNAVLKAKRN